MAYDQISVYKKSAENCIKSGAIFGYLDHPFSERYQYGWATENERINVHRDWIEYLQLYGSVLFESEEKTLNHIRAKEISNIWLEDDVVVVDIENAMSDYPLAYEFKGSIYRLG